MEESGAHLRMAAAQGLVPAAELEAPHLSSTARLAVELYRLARSAEGGPRFEAVAAAAERVGWDVWDAWAMAAGVHEEIEGARRGDQARG